MQAHVLLVNNRQIVLFFVAHVSEEAPFNQNFFDGVHTQASIQNLPEPQRDFLQDAMLASDRSVKHAPQEPFAAFPLAVVPSSSPPSTAEGEDAPGDQSLQKIENVKPPSDEKQLPNSLSHTPSVDNPPGLYNPNQNFFDGVHTQASIQNLPEPQRDFLQDAILASDRSVKHVPQEPFAAFPLAVVPSSIPPSTAEGEDALGDQSAQQLENAKQPSVEKQLADSFSHTPSVDNPPGLYNPNQNFFDGVHTQASIQNLPEPQRDFLQDAMLASGSSVKHAPQEPFTAFPLTMVPSSIPPSTAEGEDAPGDRSLQQPENAKPPSDEKQLADSLSHAPSVNGSQAGLFQLNQEVDAMDTQPHPSVLAPLDKTPSGLFKPRSVVEQMQPCPQIESSLPEVTQPTQQEPEAKLHSSPDFHEMLQSSSLKESSISEGHLFAEPDNPGEQMQPYSQMDSRLPEVTQPTQQEQQAKLHSFSDFHEMPQSSSLKESSIPEGHFLAEPDNPCEQMQPYPQMDSRLPEVTQPTQQEQQAILHSFSDFHEMPQSSSLKESSIPEGHLLTEPDSPRDAFQAAFHQKQLAGKAPTSSPRTSLWMHSAPLPTPCVLAPAAVATVESADLHGNDQPSPVEREVFYKIIMKVWV